MDEKINNNDWILYLYKYLIENGFNKDDFKLLNKDEFIKKYNIQPKDVIKNARESFKTHDDISYKKELLETHKEIKKYTQDKQNEIIDIVKRHTTYDNNKIIEELKKYNYNYEKVIENYLNIKKETKESKSLNQEIYKNIRVFLSK
jgi:hypothetical protein